jgi:hypothetical protein
VEGDGKPSLDFGVLLRNNVLTAFLKAGRTQPVAADGTFKVENASW